MQVNLARPSEHAQLHGLLLRLALTSVAAGIAETATYPIDVIKTQLQLQNNRAQEAAGRQANKRASLELAQRVITSQGVSGLYAGLSPAVVRHVFYTGDNIEHWVSCTLLAHTESGTPGHSPNSGSSLCWCLHSHVSTTVRPL